jgi:hypothetical protein
LTNKSLNLTFRWEKYVYASVIGAFNKNENNCEIKSRMNLRNQCKKTNACCFFMFEKEKMVTLINWFKDSLIKFVLDLRQQNKIKNTVIYIFVKGFVLEKKIEGYIFVFIDLFWFPFIILHGTDWVIHWYTSSLEAFRMLRVKVNIGKEWNAIETWFCRKCVKNDQNVTSFFQKNWKLIFLGFRQDLLEFQNSHN